MHGANNLPKIVVGTRRDTRHNVDQEPISYDEISRFCAKQESLVFVETCAIHQILGQDQGVPSMMQDEVQDELVDSHFERPTDEHGVIPISDCDHPFLLGVLMALEPDFTSDVIHTCCI